MGTIAVGDATPEEAAAIAAVLTILETVDSKRESASSSQPSAWRRAALREGTGRFESVGDRP